MIKSYIHIADAPKKGRGVYTKKAIKKDTIIENTPVIVMTAEEKLLIDQTILHNYIFEWQPEGQNLCCMALGWVPLFNHSYKSNCEYYMEYDLGTMYIITVRDIKEGEELTINYNGSWNDKTPVWFDAK